MGTINLGSKNNKWEQYLLYLAHETRCQNNGQKSEQATAELAKQLRESIKACDVITAQHSKSFYLSSQLLPAEKREAMRVLYAFCRTADNLADGNVDRPAERLCELRQAIHSRLPEGNDPVLVAWAAMQDCYNIPLCYADQLIDGVERDLQHQRYPSFEELSVYCYGVASTVGLMSMRITGYSSKHAIPYAIKLGVALQITNILRDVGEDWQAGRLYLPLDELDAFGLSEADIATGRVDERWRNFMRYQITRARQLYAEAMPGISLLHSDGRLAVSAAAMLYRGILDDIEAHDYDVFARRSFVSRGRKLALLLRAYAYARTNHLAEV
jgi:phytoene synthase